MSNVEQTGEGKTPLIVIYQENSYVTFVKWLTSRTEEGNLNWNLQPNLVSAKVQVMVVQFATSPCSDHRQFWSVFTVCDDKAELIRVSSFSCGNLPLTFAVSRLFGTIIKQIEEWDEANPDEPELDPGEFTLRRKRWPTKR
jgi:hypothetical protein